MLFNHFIVYKKAKAIPGQALRVPGG